MTQDTAAEEAASAAVGSIATKVGIITGASTASGGAFAYLMSWHLADWALLVGIIGTIFTAAFSWWRGRAEALYKKRQDAREDAAHLMKKRDYDDQHERHLAEIAAIRRRNAAG
jgi:hypothetical protein